MVSPKFISLDTVPITKVCSHQEAPNFWFLLNWAVSTACSKEAGDNACSHPATSRITQDRQVSTEEPKTAHNKGVGRMGGMGSLHIFKPP
jgi:hypothetical protein